MIYYIIIRVVPSFERPTLEWPDSQLETPA